MKNPLLDIPSYIKVFQSFLGIKIYVFFLIVFVAVILDSLAITLTILLIKDFISGEASLSESSIIEFLYNKIPLIGHMSIEAAVMSLFLSKAMMTIFASSFSAYLRSELLKGLRSEINLRIDELKFVDFLTEDKGTYSNIMGEQVSKALQSFHFLTLFVSQFGSALLYLSISGFVSYTVTIWMIFVTLVVAILFKRLNLYVRNISRKYVTLNETVTDKFLQKITNYEYLKGTNSFIPLTIKINNDIRFLSILERKLGFAYAFSNSIKEPAIILILFTVIFVTATFTKLESEALLLCIGLLYRCSNSLFTMQSSWQKSLETIGSMERITSVLKNWRNQVEIKNDRNSKAKIDKINKIEIKDLNITFDSHNNIYKTDLGFTLDRNGIFIVEGQSGSGKSTLIRLLLGLLANTSGTITVNGIPMSEIDLVSYRSRIAYLPQLVPMFSGAISEYALVNRMQAEYAHMSKELPQHFAQLGLNLKNLNDGTDTLSGGQLQRISLVRESLKSADFIILDEPTSALDTNTEVLVCDFLQKESKRKKILLITHSQSLTGLLENKGLVNGLLTLKGMKQ